MISFYLHRKVKVAFSNLIYLLSRSVSLHLYLISRLHHAAVAVGLLDILEGIVLIYSYIFSY
jgi:hypothetical protein